MEEATSSKMAASAMSSLTWEEIELSESYLVCGMFEEAAALASSILTRIRESEDVGTADETVLCDMMESAAMVLVQSWRESGRTSDLLNELKSYFGSVTAIPVQVVLTSACVQVSGGHSSGVRTFLEDFLAKWYFDNNKYYAIAHPDERNIDAGVWDRHITLEVDQYLEVVEFFAFTLLGSVLNDVDHAMSWVEKAQLPAEAQQDLMRRLLSLSSVKSTSSQQDSVSSSRVEENESYPLSMKEVKQSDKPMAVLRTHDGTKLSFWNWLQIIMKKSCNAAVASNQKILMGCLVFLICYYIHKKRDNIKRVFQRRASSLKQGLVDLWQLAFSYQVNPLAAVQSLPVSANRST